MAKSKPNTTKIPEKKPDLVFQSYKLAKMIVAGYIVRAVRKELKLKVGMKLDPRKLAQHYKVLKETKNRCFNAIDDVIDEILEDRK
jgi:hypothetical protein